MKNWKLVSGILSIVLCVFVLFQSCAAGTYNALEANGEVSGSAGFLVAVFMLAGGIVSIATRKSTGKGGNIALIVMFALAAVIGFTNAGSYSDLYIWSVWCLICAVLAVVSVILNKKQAN
jgi:Ca2+/Na+ antiporter